MVRPVDEVVLSVANDEVPLYRLESMAPETITATGSANCFGRAAIIGGGFLHKGIDPNDLSLLVGMEHGLTRYLADGAPDPIRPYWYGHAILVVCLEGAATAFDERLTCFAEDIGWDPEYHDAPPLFHVDRKQLANGPQSRAEREIPYGIWWLRNHMTIHDFGDGIQYYQENHPILARNRHPWRAEDYVEAFRDLEASAIY